METKEFTREVKAEAVCWDGTREGAYEVVDWVVRHGYNAFYSETYYPDRENPGEMTLETTFQLTGSSGDLHLQEGDWVVVESSERKLFTCNGALLESLYPSFKE